MSAPQTITGRAAGAARRGHHPGLALTVLAASQLMVVLDATIVNIALTKIQTSLHFSDTSLSWVLNAYTLTFGGFLLLGGRIGDILGRRRTFIAGILLFSVASLLGGFATSSAWLLSARAVQGIGGAIASPTALALVTTNFEEGPERNRAFGVFGAVAGSGAAVGLLAGGMLTSWASWQWVFFVNVPIGVLLAVLAPMFINESERQPGRFDLAGALTSTLGMALLVYGFIRAASNGWGNSLTIGAFVGAVVLLAVFLLIETRSEQPITPLRMFANRDRSGAYVVMLLFSAALFGMFFFLTQFIQNVLGYSPLRAGFAFLPISAAVIVSAGITSRFLPSVGPRRFMVFGSVLATGSLAWLTQLSTTSNYLGTLLGPYLMFGLGMGFVFVPLTVVAVSAVEPQEAGAASSLLNVMQQVGFSLGLSILVTVFGTASSDEAKNQVAALMAHGTPAEKAQFATTHQLPGPYGAETFVHGASIAFVVGLVFVAVSVLVSAFVVRTKPTDVSTTPGIPA